MSNDIATGPADELLPPDLLGELAYLAKLEDKPLKALVEAAVRQYLAQMHRPRKHVLEALEESMNEHDELYRVLAG